MKPQNGLKITVLCAVLCILGAWLGFHPSSVVAQQDLQDYFDGSVYISSFVEVDSNDYLYLDSSMVLDFSYESQIDVIEDAIYADQDGQAFYVENDYGDFDNPIGVQFSSNNPVAAGHEYGLTSYGLACYDNQDDGAGGGDGTNYSDYDCSWGNVTAVYASVYVAAQSPQINSLSTYSVNQGDQGTLTITGSNFIESASDQLTLNFSGGNNPFTLASAPSTCTSTCTATFSYDFTGYPGGAYTLSVMNNEGTSNSENFAVVASAPSGPPQIPPIDPCAVTSDPKVGSTTIVETGTTGGGTMSILFSGSAFAKVTPTVTYGPYSTPSSIASNIAALISKKYLQYGVSARAFGPNIVYGGISALGSVSTSFTGSSFSTDTSSTAANEAAAACYALPKIPCLGLYPDYDTARLYKQAGITETPRQHITRKHIVEPPTLVPKNTVYVGNGGSQPALTLVQASNFTTVLENPGGTPSGTGIVFKHTFQKIIVPKPGGYEESGFIGADAAGNDLYTNELYLSADRCTVNTSFPTP